jgi:hypothetical protein
MDEKDSSQDPVLEGKEVGIATHQASANLLCAL